MGTEIPSEFRGYHAPIYSVQPGQEHYCGIHYSYVHKGAAGGKNGCAYGAMGGAMRDMTGQPIGPYACSEKPHCM